MRSSAYSVFLITLIHDPLLVCLCVVICTVGYILYIICICVCGLYVQIIQRAPWKIYSDAGVRVANQGQCQAIGEGEGSGSAK